MAGAEPRYERVLAVAQGQPLNLTNNPNPDPRNEALVEQHVKQFHGGAFAEFMTVHEWVIDQVRAMPDATLAIPSRWHSGK